jgi:hypothetical protein
VENNRGLWEEKDEGDRRHLVVASAVCCRDTGGILASLWRLLAARREAMIVMVAVVADMTLRDYNTTIVYDLARVVCGLANGRDGKKDEMPSGNKSWFGAAAPSRRSIWGRRRSKVPTSQHVQGDDAPP